MKRKHWFLIHRWIALVVSLQLLAWSIGGLVFSVLDIENVRGNMDRAAHHEPRLPIDLVAASPQQAVAAARERGCAKEIASIHLRERGGVPVYELIDGDEAVCAVSATTGRVLPRITPDEAAGIALADFSPKATVGSVRLIEEDVPGEYRGGPVPAYQIILDHPKTPHIYVSAVTGEVTRRRNKLWRIFDFFWMLHIMDYRERENFNHWLLTAMSVLAILTAASGLVLWWLRIPWRSARRTAEAAPG